MATKSSRLDDGEASPQHIIEITDSLENVSESSWQGLAGGNPFVGYRFLRLLEETGCVGPVKGWYAKYLLLKRDGALVGVAPCYFKTHSRGEFVFDHAWANAFAQHGLQYYPKLLVASPFTPVQGPRLLALDDEARGALAEAAKILCQKAAASSAHVLFVEEADRIALVKAGYLVREGVQFHWVNEGYASVDDFLAKFSHDKRKKMRQDSKYVLASGVKFRCLEGVELLDEHLDFFYSCYTNTYLEHGSSPYLTVEFFKRAHTERALAFVLILAERDGKPVACALNVRGGDKLYGRYWGSAEFVKGLHFEACYMQSILYCIQHGLRLFEGGAQGEHKMSRGLMPVKTYSAHYIMDRTFAAAIEDFLRRESVAVDGYVSELEESAPFKQLSSSN